MGLRERRGAGAKVFKMRDTVFTAVPLKVQICNGLRNLPQPCFFQQGRLIINKLSSGLNCVFSDHRFTFWHKLFCGISNKWFVDRQLVYRPPHCFAVYQMLSHKYFFPLRKNSMR